MISMNSMNHKLWFIWYHIIDVVYGYIKRIRKRGNFKLETSDNDDCNECKSSPIRCNFSSY